MAAAATKTVMPLGWRETNAIPRDSIACRGTELEKRILHNAHLIFEEAWAKGRTEVVPEVIGPRFVRYDANNAPDYGPEGYVATILKTRTAFPDLNVEILSVTAVGNRVWTQVAITGTHLGEFVGIGPTGARVSIAGMMTALFDETGHAVVGYPMYNYLSIVSTLIHAMTWWQFLLNLPAIIHQDGLGRAPDVGWGDPGEIRGWSWLLKPSLWRRDSRRNAKAMEDVMEEAAEPGKFAATGGVAGAKK